MKKNHQSRRDFFRRTSCMALSAAAASAGLRKLGLMNLYASERAAQSTQQAGYKALVCIFMSGGNDSTNMVVPMDATPYTQYSQIRPPLAIPLGNLLPLKPLAAGNFGLHPQMTELQNLFNLNKAAIVANVGPLIQPTTRTTYRNGTAKRPFQLFSHSDQVQIFETAIANSPTRVGWAGRIADKVNFMNAGSAFPMVTSVSGSAVFGQGITTRPLTISTGALNQVLVLSGFNATPEAIARRNSMDFLRTIDRSATLIAAASDGTQESLDIAADLTVDPTLTTVFPNTGIGNQLKQVAKVMKLNQTASTLNLQRQIFFTTIGGFDTHQNETGSHNNLYPQLSKAMDAFHNATIELGIETQVTTFTMSDFGRTGQSSGTGNAAGTDHGWGSHHFVVGGAVNGGNMYGIVGSNGTVFPTLQLSGPDDTDNRLRLIPTVALDQYAATLATWFGVAPADLAYVFPLISNFGSSNLGFV